MAVTIKDVAALAGVSPSTVSRTCKNNPSISNETKERVRRAMAQLGYEPNFQASNLASQNSRTIGIILPVSEREAYENTFYLEAIRGISQFCNQRQYINTVITGENEEEILQAIRTMTRSGQVDGFIVLYSRRQDAVIDYLYSEGLLYVLIGKAYQNVNQTIYIDNDNMLAAQEATEYLYNLGHRRIAYLGSDLRLIFAADRRAGYQIALSRLGLPFRESDCIEMRTLPEAGTASMSRDRSAAAPAAPDIRGESSATAVSTAPDTRSNRSAAAVSTAPDTRGNNSAAASPSDAIAALFSAPDRPTAVLVSDDILAVTLEIELKSLGLTVPEDVSIVSFNNSLLARLTSPRLTSIDVNSLQLGTEAASQMINHIENPNLMATKILVPHHIVERESCKRV